MERIQQRMLLFWGLLHGINDWVAGYMLAHYAMSGSYSAALFAMTTYAALAFGGQLPVALWLDRNKALGTFSCISIILLLIACPVFLLHPIAAIVLAGIASAGVHVSGGCICLQNCNEKFSSLGLFTAPGVAGLTIGGFCAAINSLWLLLPFSGVLLLFFLLVKDGFPEYKFNRSKHKSPLDTHDFIMILLLLVMSVRSLLFDLVNSFSGRFGYGLLVIGLSAFVGKIAGGYMADRIGWKRWIFVTLPLAFILLELGHDNLIALAFGVACLQSSVPVTLQLLYNCIPAYAATASALSLGTIIAIAGLPLYMMPYLHVAFRNSTCTFYWLLAVLSVLLFLGLFFYAKRTGPTSPVTD